ncbi:MAG TPA: nuclear transport factor 2 family protein [Chthoniobacterales bacterium]|nr:nuclear transport factor 2 family protein [Chthoniobacterales bacterium]
MWKAFICVGIFCSLVQATATPTRTAASVDLPVSLQHLLHDYEEAWQRHDAHALAKLFAVDGYVLADGSPPVKGRAEIERLYANAGGPLSLRAIAFAMEGNIGYIIGGFARQEGEPDLGKFTLTLRRKTEGHWVIVSDMDNSNRKAEGR